jgi:hypothetical protein
MDILDTSTIEDCCRNLKLSCSLGAMAPHWHRWGPETMAIHRINHERTRRCLNDHAVGFYERIVTFEDQERHTEPVAAANVNAELLSICNAIADRVASQSGGIVVLQSHVLVFKRDSRARFGCALSLLFIKVKISGEEPTTVLLMSACSYRDADVRRLP